MAHDYVHVRRLLAADPAVRRQAWQVEPAEAQKTLVAAGGSLSGPVPCCKLQCLVGGQTVLVAVQCASITFREYFRTIL